MSSRRTTRCCSAAALIAVASLSLGANGAEAPPSFFPVRTLWTIALNNQLTAVPAFDGPIGFFPIEGDRIVAYDLARGALMWIGSGRPRVEPDAGGRLLFVVDDTTVAALDRATGAPIWRLPFASGLAVPPIWENGWLFVATAEQELLAFRATDGRLLWRKPLGANAHARPAFAGDRVYVPTEDGRLLALRLDTGEPIWERRMGGAANDVLPVDERIYVGSNDNFLYCLLAGNGEVDWRWRTGGDVIGMPAADAERVYFVSLDNVLRALDLRSGAQRWKTALPFRPSRGPVLAGDALIVSGLAPTARAYTARDGKPAGEITPGGELAAPPHLVVQGANNLPMLIAVTRDIAKGATVTALARSFDPAVVPMVPLPNITAVPMPK